MEHIISVIFLNTVKQMKILILQAFAKILSYIIMKEIMGVDICRI